MNTKKMSDGRYLIDSYIEEVGQNLPLRQRDDIQAEIRSLLEDTLEDRLQETGNEPDVETVASLLKEFGAPQKMALSYAPDRYLIGPKMFPLFLLVLKIVLSVVIVLAMIGTGIAVSQAVTPEDGLRVIGNSALELLGSLMSVFGNIVIVFAILERVLPEGSKSDEDWDPRKLKPVSNEERVKPVEIMINMVFATIGIIIFNFFPQVIRAVSISNGQVEIFQLMDTNIARFIPWLTALWALEIIFSIILLWQRRWDLVTRWVNIGLDVLGMVLLSVMIFGGPLLVSSTAAPAVWSDEALIPLADTGLKIALGIALAVNAISVIETLVKIISKKAMKMK
jgi:hypothetical protein